MPLDHSKATVTISVAGLALSCINRLKQNRCEIGILRCDRHRPLLDIQKIELDKRGSPLRSCLVPHSLSLDEDISIDLVHHDASRSDASVSDAGGGPHCERGVSTYMRREFNRLKDKGDAEDFRWVADLEGPEFHNRKLKIKHRSKLRPTI